MLKYGQEDARNILERASARETAIRVAAGGVLRYNKTERRDRNGYVYHRCDRATVAGSKERVALLSNPKIYLHL